MEPTQAEKLLNDPDFIEAKATLLSAVQRHTSTLTGVRKPQGDRRQRYEDLLAELEGIRAGKLIYPYLGSGLGNGIFVELEDGSVKYDMICGIGVYQFGRNNPSIMASSLDAAVSDTLIQGHFQQNKDSLELSNLILNLANKNQRIFEHCFLSTSGVMAGENALKLTFHKKAPANRVIVFENGFSGRTIAFSHMNDKAASHAGLPTCFPVDRVPFYDPSDPEGSTESTLKALASLYTDHPGEHAAIVIELIQGEGGFNVGHQTYLRKVMESAKSQGIAVLADEIQTFSRLTEPFAYQIFKLEDLIDITWIGKASQVCATLFSKEFVPKPGLMGQTYTGATSTIKGAITILSELSTGGYFGENGKIHVISEYVRDKLRVFAEETALIEGPYGLGSMVSFVPLGGSSEKVTDFLNKLFDNGVIALSAGSNPMKCRFLLPYPILTEDQVDEVLNITFETIRELS